MGLGLLLYYCSYYITILIYCYVGYIAAIFIGFRVWGGVRVTAILL